MARYGSKLTRKTGGAVVQVERAMTTYLLYESAAGAEKNQLAGSSCHGKAWVKTSTGSCDYPNR